MQTPKNILDFLHFDCPTTEQKDALLAMQTFIKETNIDNFLILCGAAGTGKTSITSALIGYLNEQSVCYKIAAPTGRAARILGRKTNTLNATIHSMIYDVEGNSETGEVVFKPKRNDDPDFTIFIIDEASMISTVAANDELTLFKSENSLLHDLIRYVKSGNAKNKIIFLGDRNQLPPVKEEESLALVPDYLSKKHGLKGTLHFLTEVKRQEDGSYILKDASRLREAIDKVYNGYVPLSGEKLRNIYNAIPLYVKDYQSNGHEHAVSIGCTHNSNQLFNKLVREAIYGKSVKLIEKGDLMLVTQKWSRGEHHLYNGDHVVIEEIDLSKAEYVAGMHFAPVKIKSNNLNGTEQIIEDYLLVESIDNPSGQFTREKEGKLRQERYAKNTVFRKSGLPSDDRYVGAIRLAYGHSITCNKAQGGEWNKVYMNTYFLPSLKYQYTALTRAKNDLIRY